MDVIDEVSRNIRDPLIFVNVSPVSSATESLIRVGIGFTGYDMSKYVFIATLVARGVRACDWGRHEGV